MKKRRSPNKVSQTTEKRLRRRPSGLIERTVQGNQHLLGRKSKRQKRAAKAGTVSISSSDRSQI